MSVDQAAGSGLERAASQRRRQRRARRRRSRLTVAGITVAAALGGGCAGCHPTGTRIVDPLYTAVIAVVVTLAASRSRRATWLFLAGVAMALSRGLVLLPAIAGLGTAFGSVFVRRKDRLGALVGALAVQAVLRWPPVGPQGLTALLAFVAIAPCCASAYFELSTRWRRRIRRTAVGVVLLAALLTIPAAVGAFLARPHVEAAIDNTQGAVSSVSSGGTTTAVIHLEAAKQQLASARNEGAAWWTWGARLVPVAAQQHQAIARTTIAAQALTAAGLTEASRVDVHTFASTNGHFNLPAVEATYDPLQALDAQLTATRNTIRSVDSSWLLPQIRSRLTSFDRQLTTASNSVSLATEAVRAAPSLLGGNGTRHYFVAFMTPSESRGLDGFIGSFAELTVSRGNLSITRQGPIGELNPLTSQPRRVLTGLPDYLERYGGFDVADHIQDVSYSPDFPTVAKVISQLYPQAGGDPVDGVLALDPYGLAALLRITGPVRVAGLSQPLTEANAAQILLKGQYDTFNAESQQTVRHDFLQDALSVAFAKLTSTSLPSPAELSAVLYPAVRQDRFLFWSEHPADQPLLDRLGLDGAFPAAAGHDVLAITTANAGNNKIDAYLGRSVNDQVDYDPSTGATRSTVTITLHNGAPSAGLPPDVIGSYPGSGLPVGTNRLWLSLYTPLQLTGASEDGRRIGLESSPELGMNAFSVYVDIPAEGTTTLRVQLAGELDLGPTYHMAFRRQPAVLPEQDEISVNATGGWSPANGSSTWRPPTPADTDHDFDFRPSS